MWPLGNVSILKWQPTLLENSGSPKAPTSISHDVVQLSIQFPENTLRLGYPVPLPCGYLLGSPLQGSGLLWSGNIELPWLDTNTEVLSINCCS